MSLSRKVKKTEESITSQFVHCCLQEPASSKDSFAHVVLFWEIETRDGSGMTDKQQLGRRIIQAWNTVSEELRCQSQGLIKTKPAVLMRNDE